MCVCIYSNVSKSDFLRETWKVEEEHCAIQVETLPILHFTMPRYILNG